MSSTERNSCAWNSSSLEDDTSVCCRCFSLEDVIASYCQDCDEHYCKNCSFYHKLYPLARKHIVNMIGDQAQLSEPEINELEDKSDVYTVVREVLLNNEKSLEALKAASILIYKDSKNTDELANLGMIAALMKCLQSSEDYRLHFEVMEVFSIMAASKQHIFVNELINSGAVKLLVPYISSPHHNIVKSTIRTLTSVAGYAGDDYRDHVIGIDALRPILAYVNSFTPLPVLRSVSAFISIIFKECEAPIDKQILKEILSSVSILITHTDRKVLLNSLIALYNVTFSLEENVEKQIQLVIESGVVPRCVSLLHHDDIQIQKAAIKTLGNIVMGTDKQTQVVLNLGFLSELKPLLLHGDDKIKEESYVLLSNIAAGNKAQIQSVIDEGLLRLAIDQLSEIKGEVQKEAAWVIGNVIVNGTKEQAFQYNAFLDDFQFQGRKGSAAGCINAALPLSIMKTKAGAGDTSFFLSILNIKPPELQKKVSHLMEQEFVSTFCALLDSSDDNLLRITLQGLQELITKRDDKTTTVCTMIQACGGEERIKLQQYNADEGVYELASEIMEKHFPSM